MASRTPRLARRNTQQETLNLDKFGMELADVTPEMAEQLGFKGKMSGAIVTQVEANSPAADAGLRRGMVIAKVDKKAVTSADGVKEALDKVSSKQDVLLQVQTAQGGTDFKLLKVGVEK